MNDQTKQVANHPVIRSHYLSHQYRQKHIGELIEQPVHDLYEVVENQEIHV